MKGKKGYMIGGIILGVITLYLLTMYIIDYKTGKNPDMTSVIVLVLLTTSWFQFFTWGSDTKVQKDELGKRVARKSATISYYTITASLFLIWIIDRIVFLRKNDLGNISLFFALCLALVLHPIVQFFVARRYR